MIIVMTVLRPEPQILCAMQTVYLIVMQIWLFNALRHDLLGFNINMLKSIVLSFSVNFS